MRRWPPSALAVLLTAPLLAGCLSDDPTPDGHGLPVLDMGTVIVPENATLIQEDADGAVRAVLRWANISLPFEEEITLPAGATIVRTTTTVAEDVSVRSYMKHSDTGRRRCNPDIADTAWNVGVTGTHTCSGMTAIDRPGDKWTIQASGVPAKALTVDVIFEAVAPDGIVASLDLSQLSMRDHQLQETTYGYVESFDGTRIWTEVTLPEGDGPWPTIIAASPYNGFTNRLGSGPDAEPAMWAYWSKDWAERGYAVVNTDVRGFGLSEGCVEVWSENEQRDQKFTVDWVAEQPWSNGQIGFYGQSYVATTPLAAASLGAEALDAVVMVAPVVNAYEDWHYGGVPNGENAGSPAAYQALTDAPQTPYANTGDPVGTATRLPGYITSLDPAAIAQYSIVGLCDATLPIEANDPRAIYDAFYEERNFKKMVDNIEAAVLFTEGFEDANVKSQMIPDWFNHIDAPKLGLFGHWVHQHPTRADEEVLFLGWMDQYVKGKPLGFESLPTVEVVNNLEQTRQAESWPDARLTVRNLTADFSAGTLVDPDDTDAAVGSVDIVLSPAAETQPIADSAPVAEQVVTVSMPVTEPFAFSGIVTLQVAGTLNTQGNAYLAATLYDVHDGKRDLVTYGMRNLAHNDDHTAFEPVLATGGVYPIGFLPTEYVMQDGHELVIELRGVQALVDGLTLPGQPGTFTVGPTNGAVPTLELPLVPLSAYTEAPATATR